ncbi:aminotransferase class V-fold PLP-dependent enzyme [Geomesophilobacter sediminis]|uniref:cysteine desulfurase n=1 Tax=Geomesophilobacter sediminis TaxID=2798584 RepID=A0A8J7M2L0_9BACT|nr:cysteine desulfurase [Geomesophilobacter sediminis]MBJ6727158.1 cysteine desulfurase [Geomesophilobacter sediminis]
MDVEAVRRDFPILEKNGADGVIYLDNACQSLRPRAVIDAINGYYLTTSACSGRSMHRLAEEVSRQLDQTRAAVASFLNASRKEEIIFTRNTTEGINLVAHALDVGEKDVILVSDKEHNSNLLPWQLLTQRTGAALGIVSSLDDNSFDLAAFEKLLDDRVKLVCLGYTSNLDGVSIPAREIVKMTHDHGALVLFDAAQAAPHRRIEVKALDVDFVAFSGHKMLGPSGTGILFGKYPLLEQMRPFMVGGGTVSSSTYEGCEFLPPPEKFEAGLHDYGGIIGLGAAVAYLQRIGFDAIERQELLLNRYLTEALRESPRIRLIGPAAPELRGGIFSFHLPGIDPHRIALMLDQMAKVMVRSGQHCVHSWFNKHSIAGSVRASAYFYNTIEEAEVFVRCLRKIEKVL